MKKVFVLSYGLVYYLALFGTILHVIGFVDNLVVPKSIDSNPDISFSLAILIDVSLLFLFALQHNIMARRAFKSWWTKFSPGQLERSTYILMGNISLLILLWQWQLAGGVVWSLENQIIKNLLFFVYLCGWLFVFFSALLITHFELVD